MATVPTQLKKEKWSWVQTNCSLIEDFDKYDDMTKSGEITVAEACKRMNIAPATFYRLRRLRENPEKK